jgi:hypothetical protein
MTGEQSTAVFALRACGAPPRTGRVNGKRHPFNRLRLTVGKAEVGRYTDRYFCKYLPFRMSRLQQPAGKTLASPRYTWLGSIRPPSRPATRMASFVQNPGGRLCLCRNSESSPKPPRVQFFNFASPSFAILRHPSPSPHHNYNETNGGSVLRTSYGDPQFCVTARSTTLDQRFPAHERSKWHSLNRLQPRHHGNRIGRLTFTSIFKFLKIK